MLVSIPTLPTTTTSATRAPSPPRDRCCPLRTGHGEPSRARTRHDGHQDQLPDNDRALYQPNHDPVLVDVPPSSCWPSTATGPQHRTPVRRRRLSAVHHRLHSQVRHPEGPRPRRRCAAPGGACGGADDLLEFTNPGKSRWRWTMLIRQPVPSAASGSPPPAARPARSPTCSTWSRLRGPQLPAHASWVVCRRASQHRAGSTSSSPPRAASARDQHHEIYLSDSARPSRPDAHRASPTRPTRALNPGHPPAQPAAVALPPRGGKVDSPANRGGAPCPNCQRGDQDPRGRSATGRLAHAGQDLAVVESSTRPPGWPRSPTNPARASSPPWRRGGGLVPLPFRRQVLLPWLDRHAHASGRSPPPRHRCRGWRLASGINPSARPAPTCPGRRLSRYREGGEAAANVPRPPQLRALQLQPGLAPDRGQGVVDGAPTGAAGVGAEATMAEPAGPMTLRCPLAVRSTCPPARCTAATLERQRFGVAFRFSPMRGDPPASPTFRVHPGQRPPRWQARHNDP